MFPSPRQETETTSREKSNRSSTITTTLNDCRLRDAANNIAHSFLHPPLSSSENPLPSRRGRYLESTSKIATAPSTSPTGHIRADYRLGYPASSAWASSGYRSITTQLQSTVCFPEHPSSNVSNQHSCDGSSIPSFEDQPFNIDDSCYHCSSTSVTSHRCPMYPPLYQSSFWRFPYGYPTKIHSKPTPPSDLYQANEDHLSSVKPIRYRGVSSQAMSQVQDPVSPKSIKSEQESTCDFDGMKVYWLRSQWT